MPLSRDHPTYKTLFPDSPTLLQAFGVFQSPVLTIEAVHPNQKVFSFPPPWESDIRVDTQAISYFIQHLYWPTPIH